MADRTINLPLTDDTVRSLHAGDRVFLNGIIYTARDEAHLYLCRLIDAGKPLPVEMNGTTIYYTGPCPAAPGQVIGSCGPTTSGRMDAYAPRLMDIGLKGMIGKGSRNEQVVEAMKRNVCVYFAAIGGAGALLSSCVKEAAVVAFPELGAEAIYRLRVENFPCTVIIDCDGRDLYAEGRSRYEQKKTL